MDKFNVEDIFDNILGNYIESYVPANQKTEPKVAASKPKSPIVENNEPVQVSTQKKKLTEIKEDTMEDISRRLKESASPPPVYQPAPPVHQPAPPVQYIPVISEEIEEQHSNIHLEKDDAELVNKLLKAKRISEASGVDINTVLLEMAAKASTSAASASAPSSKKRINFNKNTKGEITGAEIIIENT